MLGTEESEETEQGAPPTLHKRIDKSGETEHLPS